MKKIILLLAITALVLFSGVFSGCTDESKKTENARQSGQVAITNQGTFKLTLDEIKKKYTDSKILNIQNISEEFVLVESQQDTFANRFDLYNLRTGSMDTLPTMPEFVSLEKAENENYFVFLASGKDSESPFSRFPYIIKCFRTKNDNFTAIYEDKYLSLDESIQVGSKEGSIMSDVNITFDGLEVLFKPAKGKEAGFYADAADIPPTKTSYVKDKQQIIFEIATNQLGENLKGVKKAAIRNNQYISSYEIIQKDNKTYLVVDVRDSAKRYLIKIKSMPNGNMPDGFPYFTVEFKGEA